MRRSLVQCLVILVGVFAIEWDLPAANGQDIQITNQTRQALAFYGGRSAMATLSEMPRRSPIQPSSAGPMPHSGKPFQTASTGPTVSPYLNLFREEKEGAEAPAPNYYAFVRPQLEQQAASQQQQREIQQLQQQLQSNSSTRIVPQYGVARAPGSGTPARFMDTAQFYGGWQR